MKRFLKLSSSNGYHSIPISEDDYQTLHILTREPRTWTLGLACNNIYRNAVIDFLKVKSDSNT